MGFGDLLLMGLWALFWLGLVWLGWWWWRRDSKPKGKGPGRG